MGKESENESIGETEESSEEQKNYKILSRMQSERKKRKRESQPKVSVEGIQAPNKQQSTDGQELESKERAEVEGKQTQSEQPTKHIALPDQVVSYGQQLRYERELRGWTEEQLAEKIRVSPERVKEWETNRRELNRADRRKLIEFLGRNDYYLSSEVFDNGDLQVRVVQLELTARDFTTIISALTEFHTEFWLIQQGRFPDLAEYTQTQHSRFMEEANLVIDNLTTNSPTLLTLLTDPGTATTAVTTIVTLAVALQKAIDVITQTWKKIQDINQGNQERKLEIQRKQFELEQEQLRAKREQFEWEEEQVKRKQKLIESSIPMVVGIANTLHPGIDEQTREIIMQAMTLTCWKLLDRE